MYLDADGQVDSRRSRFSYLSVGVPGTVAGMALALERYGTMALPEVMAPAIRLAEDGFTLSAHLAASLESRRRRFGRWPATMGVFFKADGSAYVAGERLVQADLAWSLRQIAAHGAPAFYRGAIAERITADMAANRRAHHPGRPGVLPGADTPAGARHLPRL